MSKISSSFGVLGTLLLVTVFACQGLDTASDTQESRGQKIDQLMIETPRPSPSGPKGPPNMPGALSSLPRIHVSKTELTLDEPLEIVGNGFQPGERVSILLYLDDNVQLFVGGGASAQATADGEGDFAIQFVDIGGAAEVRAGAPGKRAIVAKGSYGGRSSTPVRILSSDAPPDTSVAQYADRYGRSLPMEVVAGILTASVIQVLRDADHGVENIQRCVAINPIWISRSNDVELPEILLVGILGALVDDLDMPVFQSDFSSADDRCPREFTQHVSFLTFTLGGLSEEKLTVELRERFAGSWGGSDWKYTFQKGDGNWVLIEGRSTGAS